MSIIDKLKELILLKKEATKGEWEWFEDDNLIESNGGGVCYIVPHSNINTIRKLGEEYCKADALFIISAHNFPFEELLNEIEKNQWQKNS